jgi:polysaccharide biosynthesis protein PslG
MGLLREEAAYGLVEAATPVAVTPGKVHRARRPRAHALVVLCISLVAGLAFGFETGASGSSGSVFEVPTGQAAGISPGAGIQYLSDADLTETLNGIVSAGATWIRLDVDWPMVEPSEGTFDWSVPDRVISEAVADGLEVDAELTYTPSWAAAPGTGYPSASAFASFASAAAAHYSPMGVHTFEIWNEPNLASNWGSTVSPSAYTALLVQGYEAIKQVDPGSFVISGGLAPASDASDGSEMSPATFLTDMYASGAEGYMDAVGIHPYSYPDDPTEAASWNPFYNMPNLYQIMVANGDGSKQIWSTEFGIPTCTNSSDCVSQSTQATQLTEAFDQISQWPWAGPVFYYNWQDGTDAATNLYDSFGLVTSSFTAKPALSAFESGAALLSSGSSSDAAATTTTTTSSTTTSTTTTSKSTTTTSTSTTTTSTTTPLTRLPRSRSLNESVR